MDKLGKLVREKRIKKGETFERLAVVIGCSEAFARHIELSPTVPVSERLVKALKRHFRFPDSELERAARRRNKIGKRWYREYRAKKAA